LTGERVGTGQFGNFAGAAHHITATRSITWIVILFVPIGGMAIDLFGKVFSNMFYPTQTQIHVEIEAKERAEAKRANRVASRHSTTDVQAATPASV
jgi:hypothetical protein